MSFVIFAILVILITIIYQNCRRPKNFPPGMLENVLHPNDNSQVYILDFINISNTGPIFLPLIGSWWGLPPKGIENKIPGWRKRYGNIIGHKIGFRYLAIISGNENIVAGLKHPNFQSRLHTSTLTDRSFRKILGKYEFTFIFKYSSNFLPIRNLQRIITIFYGFENLHFHGFEVLS